MVSAEGIAAIVVAVVITAIILICSFYLLIHYQHPDDKNDAYFPKIVVVLGLTLAGVTVLGFPLDVINEGGMGLGLDMDLFWNIIFWMIPIWIFVLIPFSTFYYEADDELLLAVMVGATPSRLRPRSRILQALCSLAFVLVIVILIFGLAYLFISKGVPEFPSNYPSDSPNMEGFNLTNPPVTNPPTDSPNMEVFNLSNSPTEGYLNSILNKSKSAYEEIASASLGTFFAGLMAFIGWFFFAIFGGVGISALPLDLISGFTNRPRYMNPEESSEAKASLQKRVNEMVDLGEQIKRDREDNGRVGGGVEGVFNSLKDSRGDRKTMREFKAAVFLLEKDVTDFTAITSASEKYNPLLPWFSLFAGVISSIISLAWICHIALFIFPPPEKKSSFLNSYLKVFDFFPLLGVCMVSIFTFYLLLCAIKGCFKFGLRFLCLAIHPMEHGKTYMSSFMFNVGLILICCLPVIQFCTQAFSDYAKFSRAKKLFGDQIQFKFFSFFWDNKIFIYAMFGIAIITSLWMIFLKATKHENSKALLERLRVRS